jgi:hypothetical protein
MKTIKKRTLVILTLLFSSISSFSQVDALLGIYVKSITINQRDGIFYADLYWWIKLPRALDSTLVNDYSTIEFVNGIEISRTVVEKKITKDYYYSTGQYKGEFRFKPDFHKYPIDQQQLPIIIESVSLAENLVRLSPDSAYLPKSGWSGEDVDIHGFRIQKAKWDEESKQYKTNFGDPELDRETKYSRITYEISVERISKSFILKILIPNILLLTITYLVFFIPAKYLEVAVGCTVTSLLASIALQLTTNGSLPEIGYLTNADKLFHLFYFLITFALVQTVITFGLEKQGKRAASLKLEIFGRWIFPIVLAFGLCLILVF